MFQNVVNLPQYIKKYNFLNSAEYPYYTKYNNN